MITEEIENMKNNGFEVEEIPTGYIFTLQLSNENKNGDILIRKEGCETIQKTGKIEEIKVVGGKQLRIVVVRAVIGSG